MQQYVFLKSQIDKCILLKKINGYVIMDIQLISHIPFTFLLEPPYHSRFDRFNLHCIYKIKQKLFKNRDDKNLITQWIKKLLQK